MEFIHLGILPLLICAGWTTAGGDYSAMADMICSHEEEAKEYVMHFLQECYEDVYTVLQREHWQMCSDRETLNCKGMQKLFRVIPSCAYCNGGGTDTERQACYNKQLRETTCSVNNHLLPSRRKKCTCSKVKGHCVGTTERWGSASPTYDHDRGSPKEVPECHCEPCGQTGRVSMEGAIGLLFLGIVLGAVIATALCIFIPGLYRRTTSCIKKRKASRPKGSTLNGGTRSTTAPQALHNTNDLDQRNDGGNYINPTDDTPVDLRQPIGNEYHSLHSRRTAADSHAYAGLQPQPTHFPPPGEYLDLSSGNGPYTTPSAPVDPSGGAIESPTYQELTSDRGDPDYDETNGPMSDTSTNDANSHSYFVLEPQTQNVPNSDASSHQYFVLESQDTNNKASAANGQGST